MDVVLPSTGCNIINSATTFYNYSEDLRTRDTYVIFDGKAIKQSSSTSQYGYSYSGECLVTGDLVYKPEYKEFIFPYISIITSCVLFYLAYRLIVHKFWRKI